MHTKCTYATHHTQKYTYIIDLYIIDLGSNRHVHVASVHNQFHDDIITHNFSFFMFAKFEVE